MKTPFRSGFLKGIYRLPLKVRHPKALRFGILGLLGHSLGIKIVQKPYIVWSLGPKALIYESLELNPIDPFKGPLIDPFKGTLYESLDP